MTPKVWDLKNCRKYANVETIICASGIGGRPPMPTWINISDIFFVNCDRIVDNREYSLTLIIHQFNPFKN